MSKYHFIKPGTKSSFPFGSLLFYFQAFLMGSLLEKPFFSFIGQKCWPNNFWLRQFKIVGVGVTNYNGSSVGATFGPFDPTNGPKVPPTEGSKFIPTPTFLQCREPKTVGPTILSQQLGKRCTGWVLISPTRL